MHIVGVVGPAPALASGGGTHVVGWYALSNHVLVPLLAGESYRHARPIGGPVA